MLNNQDEQHKAPSDAPKIDQRPSIKDDVYVMPEKFHVKKSGSSNKLLIIVLVVLVLVVVVSAAYFLFDMWQDNRDPLAINNSNSNTNTINNNSNRNDNSNANTNTNDNQNSNLNDNSNANTNTNDNQNLDTPPTVSSDTDNDGLTDLEEGIFGTTASRPDTDGDGYLDGHEVASGYNPAQAGSTEADKLPAASFIDVVATDFAEDNFQTLSIDGWSANILEATHQAIITSNTGEIIKISVRANDENISAINWYMQENPQVSLSQLRRITAGELEGVFSPNGLKAYLSDPQRTKFYVFEYLMDDESEFRYPTIFDMIINNFELTEGLVVQLEQYQNDTYSFSYPADSVISTSDVADNTIQLTGPNQSYSFLASIVAISQGLSSKDAAIVNNGGSDGINIIINGESAYYYTQPQNNYTTHFKWISNKQDKAVYFYFDVYPDRPEVEAAIDSIISTFEFVQ